MATGLLYNYADELTKGKNYMLGVGIELYQKPFQRLPNARHDLEEVASVLTENYYFERDQITLLRDAKATKEDIVNAFYSLRSKLEEEDRLLIYFSGHGCLDGTEGFWIPVDAKEGNLASYIDNGHIRSIIKAIKARHILLISDSCFSDSLLLRSATREAIVTSSDLVKKTSRLVFISGGGIVSDGNAGEHSPFAEAILNQLRENKDEFLSIVTLADRVIEEIGWNNDEQTAELCPMQLANHKGGQFVFFKRGIEESDWENYLRMDTESGYTNYIDKYPSGKFIQAAFSKLDTKEWEKANSLGAKYGYEKYLEKYPKGNYVTDAQSKLYQLFQSHLKADDFDHVITGKETPSDPSLIKIELQNLIDLIGKGKLDDALKQALLISKNSKDPDYLNSFILLSGQLVQLKKENISRTITDVDFRRGINDINDSFLKIISA